MENGIVIEDGHIKMYYSASRKISDNNYGSYDFSFGISKTFKYDESIDLMEYFEELESFVEEILEKKRNDVIQGALQY